ncbi:transporter substrate-binding domain-containing protein [Ligilactobacillus salivarius]|uniref:transporter substrate-binding domain-containing protein n=1 Tax=Ligilactobacillus salivarius TaxID=1624 RepID=UPI000BAEC461|nr:transporter substrate-binding domain-containing protein [Ligilactobacillus salivarius]MBE7388285.1 transporter substrate-binding domain-containing protein [Ligilactobacillus salivarius]MBE7392835.1 transporter substrate-binding domain-containing protein [Ligilactobacillus salivarius]PAY32485.1 glutamine ABC transporter substrate-binding protein [Ligilactobacillus salivarius]PAY37812.1 glutamine ABC transporter substrate-binding protein [Ligilactobacillus salivarius]PAY43396.1 glutamine ABC 
MKNLRKVTLLFSALLMIFFLGACGKKDKAANIAQRTEQTKTVTWGVKADTRLFGLMNIKTGQIKGFDVDMAKALTKKMYGKDAKVKLVQTTAKTKIPLLKNQNIDAVIAAMTITPERRKIVEFSQPYFAAGQSLLVPDNSTIKNVHDLNKKGMVVLAVKGTTAVANIHKFAPKAKVLEFDDYGQAFTALKSGQGQAMSTDNGILAGIASENPGYQVVGGNFTNEPYGIAVDKGQTQMIKRIDKALDELKADGTYDKLIQKWFGNVKGFDAKGAGER